MREDLLVAETTVTTLNVTGLDIETPQYNFIKIYVHKNNINQNTGLHKTKILFFFRTNNIN